MSLQILSHADTYEVGSIANNTVKELQKKDWSTDAYLTTILQNLIRESTVLTDAVGHVRKNDFTERLTEKDEVFDQVFIGTKQFVMANTMSLDSLHVKNAEKIWSIFEAHDLNLNRLGYEQQIFLTNSLLKELDKTENKVIVDSLTGVSTQLDLLNLHNGNLASLYQESKEVEAAKDSSIAPSVQRNFVRDILNKDLLPYLEVMSKAKSETFGETFNVISEFVTSINTKIRARKTRNDNHIQEELVTEETNN